MQRQIYLFFEQFLIFNDLIFSLVNSKPLASENIRSAAPDEFPFVVAIQTLQEEDANRPLDFYCTGSLVSREDVITAEHCLRGKELQGIYILAGSIHLLEAEKFYPAWWIGYNEWAVRVGEPLVFLENDIVILRLTKEVAQKIIIGEFSFKQPKTFNGKDVKMAGWGQLSNDSYPEILQVIQVTILSRSSCKNQISKLEEDVYVEEKFLCSAAQPYGLMRSGDSGGPVIHNNKIIGISAGTCPLPEVPFHPDKVNLHNSVEFYKYYILDVVNNY